ncbi:MAG: polysaccharide biosynthesis protein [Halanaerobiales bacterium]|nr:polysaccharide biosynthesis protein [Halanaerobiales bacterium]
MFEKLMKLYKKPYLIIIDIFLINLALLFSYILRFDRNFLSHLEYEFFIAITIFGLIALYITNMYNKIWHYASIAELKAIMKTSLIINAFFIVYLYFFMISFSRSVVIINLVLDVFALGGTRFLLRLLKGYYMKNKSNKPQKNILVVGAGDAGDLLIREYQKHPELGKNIIGVIDDDKSKHGLEIHGIKVLGERNIIPDVIDEYDVEEVVIAIPSAKGKEIKDIYNLSKKEDVKVKTVPSIHEIIDGQFNVNQVREVQVEDLLKREQVNLIEDEISGYLSNKIIFITGGAGSIGSELCRQSAKFKPEKIIIFDINENDSYFLKRELNENFPNLDTEVEIGSIRDRKKVFNSISKHKPNVIFHAAAHKHVPLMENNPEEAVKNNIFGTKNLIEAADQNQVKRFILISTDKAVNPTNVMGATKRVAEMFVQSYSKKSNTKYMAVRFGNVLGSKGSVIPIFKKQIKNGGPITVTHPKVRRYFMTIPEAAQLVIQSGAIGNGGEVFILDMGEPIKIIELARDLIKLSGYQEGVDINIEITGLRPGEKMYEEILLDTEDDISTKHEKIYISNLNCLEENEFIENINNLEVLADQTDKKNIIKVLKNIVKEYEPENNIH